MCILLQQEVTQSGTIPGLETEWRNSYQLVLVVVVPGYEEFLGTNWQAFLPADRRARGGAAFLR